MPRYLVKNIYKYSEEVWVTADSESEAKDKAGLAEGAERNHDDTWYDSEILESDEDETED